MSGYVDTLDRFAGGVAGDLTRLHARARPERFDLLALVLLVGAVSRAWALADVALAGALTALRARVVAPVGLTPPDSTQDGLVAALRDMLASPQYELDADRAVEVLARAEVLAAAQDAYSTGLVAHGVPGWTRVPNSTACQMCRDLSGDVLPSSVPMFHHKGCGCTQRPVITERTT